MKLDEVAAALDAYFRVADVRGDDWSPTFDFLYPEPYWRVYAEPDYPGRWNGLFARGGEEVEGAQTCAFPSNSIIASLPPRRLLFSEHPIAFEDDVAGFAPLARESFERLAEDGSSFYHVHAPLDQHPEVSPSRLVAEGLSLADLDEYYPIADGLLGGAAILGRSDLTIDQVAAGLRRILGAEIPVVVLSRPRGHAGAGSRRWGADVDILRASLERGCETYVTGNAATRCRLDFVRKGVRAFRTLADEAAVAVIDATHYGLEKPPQLAMVAWFENLGLAAEFRPGAPERAA